MAPMEQDVEEQLRAPQLMPKILHKPHDYSFILLLLLLCINVAQRLFLAYLKGILKV